MSELRPWSEEGATPEETALLEAAKRERPDAATRARVYGALGLGTGATLLAGKAGAVAASGLGLPIKLGIAVLLVSGAAATGVWVTSGEPTPPIRREAPAAVAPQEPRIETTPSVEAPSSPPRRPRTPKPTLDAPPAASPSTLPQEVAALDKVRQALAANAPENALRELEAYRQRFPNGELATEEIVLRVQALLGAGEHAAARLLADQFSRAHPDSPFVKQIHELVDDAPGR